MQWIKNFFCSCLNQEKMDTRPHLNCTEAAIYLGASIRLVLQTVFMYVSRILEEKYLLVSDFVTKFKFVPSF